MAKEFEANDAKLIPQAKSNGNIGIKRTPRNPTGLIVMKYIHREVNFCCLTQQML